MREWITILLVAWGAGMAGFILGGFWGTMLTRRAAQDKVAGLLNRWRRLTSPAREGHETMKQCCDDIEKAFDESL